jgi:hypothetical protein
VPLNGAHHSSWANGAGSADGNPIGTPDGRTSRKSRARRQTGQSVAPSAEQPAHAAGNAMSSNADARVENAGEAMAEP